MTTRAPAVLINHRSITVTTDRGNYLCCKISFSFSFSCLFLFKSCNCVCVFVTGVMDLVVGNSIWLTERQRENPSFVSLHKLWTTTILLVLLLVRPKFLYLSTNKAFNNNSSSSAQNMFCKLTCKGNDASVDLLPRHLIYVEVPSMFLVPRFKNLTPNLTP